MIQFLKFMTICLKIRFHSNSPHATSLNKFCFFRIRNTGWWHLTSNMYLISLIVEIEKLIPCNKSPCVQNFKSGGSSQLLLINVDDSRMIKNQNNFYLISNTSSWIMSDLKVVILVRPDIERILGYLGS